MGEWGTFPSCCCRSVRLETVRTRRGPSAKVPAGAPWPRGGALIQGGGGDSWVISSDEKHRWG